MYLLMDVLIFLLCVIKSNQWQPHVIEKFQGYENSLRMPNRLLDIMRSYYEEANVRVAEMNNMRFMYEESPHYEQGYIMGEIIERYRKIVEHAKRPHKFKSDALFETLRRVELTQKLYFEVYHLVRMMHESMLKYKYDPEFFDSIGQNTTMSFEDIQSMQKQFEMMQRKRAKEKKKRLKLNEKLRQMYMKGLSQSVYGVKKTPYNKWWPIDYGWEIDYYW